MSINKATANFLKPVSWQRDILYFIQTLKTLQITFILDILDLPDHPDYDQRSHTLFLSAIKALMINSVSLVKLQGQKTLSNHSKSYKLHFCFNC